jgi:hypothetical protein
MKTHYIEVQKVKAMSNSGGLIKVQIDALVQLEPTRDEGPTMTSTLTLNEPQARVLMLLLKAQLLELDTKKAKSRR